jgi:3-phosphoshikimate 1-carboxyvinyltransferase
MEICHRGEIGEDVRSVVSSLNRLGAKIQMMDGKILVGVSDVGFPIHTSEGLNLGNSGTGLRMLMSLCSSLSLETSFTGDSSLRSRPFDILSDALSAIGCDCKRSNDGSLRISGPANSGDIELDLSEGSQPLSALLMAAPSMKAELSVRIIGKPVSRGYLDLSYKIAKLTGSENEFSENSLIIKPWEIVLPERVDAPPERSLVPVIMLLERLHDVDLGASMHVESELLGNAVELLQDNNVDILDLSDASDLITPAAALLALGEGGTITGIGHVDRKESHRVRTTIELLSSFGMTAYSKDGGIIEVPGRQTLIRPETKIETHSDHRVAMTALVLASRVGGVILGHECVGSTHPNFTISLLKLLQQ